MISNFNKSAYWKKGKSVNIGNKKSKTLTIDYFFPYSFF